MKFPRMNQENGSSSMRADRRISGPGLDPSSRHQRTHTNVHGEVPSGAWLATRLRIKCQKARSHSGWISEMQIKLICLASLGDLPAIAIAIVGQIAIAMLAIAGLQPGMLLLCLPAFLTVKPTVWSLIFRLKLEKAKFHSKKVLQTAIPGPGPAIASAIAGMGPGGIGTTKQKDKETSKHRRQRRKRRREQEKVVLKPFLRRQ